MYLANDLAFMRRHPLTRLAVVFKFISVLINGVSCIGPDEAKTVALKWAPRIFLHHEETYLPLSIEEFLAHTQCLLPNSPPNSPPLEGLPQGQESNQYYLTTKEEKADLLNKPSSFLHGRIPTTSSPVPMYAVIKECDFEYNHFVITYYALFGLDAGEEMCSFKMGNMNAGVPMFKMFNKCIGAKKVRFGSHVGDFESMTLEIKNSVPDRLVLSVHGTDIRYKYNSKKGMFMLDWVEKKGLTAVQSPPDTIMVVDNRIFLYAAKGTHSFYGAAGKFKYTFLKLPAMVDSVDGGPNWDTWNHLEIYLLNQQMPAWFNFGGKWGNRKSECTGALKNLGINEICTYSDGPKGLVHRGHNLLCNSYDHLESVKPGSIAAD